MQRHQVVLWRKLWEGDQQQWLTASSFHYTFLFFFWLFFFFCLSVQSCGMHPHTPPPFTLLHSDGSRLCKANTLLLLLLLRRLFFLFLPHHEHTPPRTLHSPPPPPLSAGAHFSPDVSCVCVCGGVRTCACEDFPEDMLPLWLLTSPSSNNSRPPLPPPKKHKTTKNVKRKSFELAPDSKLSHIQSSVNDDGTYRPLRPKLWAEPQRVAVRSLNIQG